jgi:hypothetical protein
MLVKVLTPPRWQPNTWAWLLRLVHGLLNRTQKSMTKLPTVQVCATHGAIYCPKILGVGDVPTGSRLWCTQYIACCMLYIACDMLMLQH